MGLSGKAIGTIREAIKSAFTGRDKLVMMLRIQLDMEESDVPDASDYNMVIFDLIIKFEKEGRIPDLIRGALREVPGNFNLQNLPETLIPLIPKDNDGLQEIYQEINIIVLQRILINIACENNSFIHQAKQIYCKYFFQDFYEDWEDTISDDNIIGEILYKLGKISQDGEIESPLIRFNAYLLERLRLDKISHSKLGKLENWVKNNANDYPALLNQIKKDYASKNKSETIPTYLIVLLKSSQQQSERYSVSAWLISDGRNDKFNYKTGENYKYLEIPNQQQETFSLAEISGLLAGYIDQATQYINENSSLMLPTIEIFLPYELLNTPIDTWEIEIEDDFFRPIGIHYNVIVRSSNRLSKKYKFRNIWIQKWHSLKDFPKRKCSQYFVSGEFASCEELLPKINQDDIFALTLINSPPTKEYFQVINTTGIPVALWFREELNISNSQDEIDRLLECVIAELPERVKQKRSLDFASERESRIGHHLSLLWENPYILPPEITYTTP